MAVDPFCKCGYRKSLHINDGIPVESEHHNKPDRFVASVTFNESIMTLGRTADSEMEMA